MDIKASVDIGDNITGLLEKLAAQIGTTADKVFPWYVQQAQLEGITCLAALGLFGLVALIIFLLNIRKADLENGNRYAAGVVISAGLGFFVVFGFSVEGVDGVRKILNPNYYAMKMMTRDVGRLTGR